MSDHMHGQLINPLPPAPPPLRPRGPRTLWAVTAAAVIVAAAALLYAAGVIPGLHATGTPKPTADATFTMIGSITLHGQPLEDWTFVTPPGGGAASCEGTGGFSDMTSGTAVTVANSTGGVVATGSLGDGLVVVRSGGDALGECVLPIRVSGVPRGLAEYVVTVSHRGSRVLSAEAALRPLVLSLGS